MSDYDRIQAILRKADPDSNSSWQERKVALEMAHKQMDKTGISYASLGISQSVAERIENQFSVTSSTKPKKHERSAGLSIFSNSGEIAVHTPRYRQQPTQKPKPRIDIPDWEAENEKKQQMEWDRGYDAWAKWRHDEDIKQAQSAESGKREIKIIFGIFILVLAVGAAVLLSQNSAIIDAAKLVVEIFGIVFFSLLAFFALVVLRN